MSGALVVKNFPSQDDTMCPSNQENPPLHILSETVQSTLKSLSNLKIHPHQQLRCFKLSRSFLYSEDFSAAQDNHANMSFLFSADSYTTKSFPMFITCHAFQPE